MGLTKAMDYDQSNLLHETVDAIVDEGYTFKDVAWIGSVDGKYAINWIEFAKIADFEYDSGFGGAEIVGDLVVVLKDGTWLERHEYDGSEWWEYKKTPQPSPDAKKFDKLTGYRLGKDY